MAHHTRTNGLLNRSQTRRELLRTMAAAAGLASVGTFLAACNGDGEDDAAEDDETPEDAADEEEATPTSEEAAEEDDATPTPEEDTEDDATAEATPDETEEDEATAEATPEETEEEDAAAGGNGGEEHLVEMTAQNVFDPEELTISVGDTVTWRTVGAIPHTSTCDEDEASNPEEHVQRPEGAEPWDSGTLGEGEEFSHTFEVAGEYTYFCIPHEAVGMIGYITVEEA